MKTGTVFLVGAGPGDPELLTEQGKACLKQADVVVHDALACSSVLNLTRPDCELIFAGKTAGNGIILTRPRTVPRRAPAGTAGKTGGTAQGR